MSVVMLFYRPETMISDFVLGQYNSIRSIK